MTIGPGTRIGVYEVVSPLGAGGMGEVFRARDTRLNREVALKVLPEFFATDPERLARFEREAQALASLKHPHIATIHGIEEKDGIRALVLELVPGESLADRIARGPLPVEEAVTIARQVADALEAAHERGIIHRDLKPANIQITPEGNVKVLDFGLAKLAAGEIGAGSDDRHPLDVTTSPTMVSPTGLTAATVLLGTAGYMSPEQARGKTVDKRADIWAFGVVLFEMLTGDRAFPGETVTEVAGGVIHKELGLSTLPDETPGSVRLVVERCLQKDPRQRFRDMGDVRLALDGALSSSAPTVAGDVRRFRSFLPIAGAAIAAALIAGVAVWQVTRPQPVERTSFRFSVSAPNPRIQVPLIDLSPDGQSIAFLQNAVDGPRLWVHSLATGESHELPAAGSINRPVFWSWNSKSIGYWSGGKVKRLNIDGGPPEVLADAKNVLGGSWGMNGTIVFDVGPEGLFRVPDGGGTPVKITSVDKARDELAHLLPHFLPDGRHFLYLRLSNNAANTGVYVGSVDETPDKQNLTRLMATRQAATYLPGDDPNRGHLLFLRDGLLMAQPFDAATLRLSGDARTLVNDPVLVTNDVYGAFAASSSGTVLYVPAIMQTGSLVTVDRTGKVQPIPGGTRIGKAFNPRLSPDGRRIVLVVDGALWVYDFSGKPPIKLSFSGDRFSPLWTPDGMKIVYEADAVDGATLFTIPSDGSSATADVAGPKGHFHPHGWTAEGQLVAARLADGSTDLVRFGPRADAKVEPIQQTPANEGMSASVSPDGKWVAYDASTTGRAEIWVRPLSGPGSAVRVSPEGGYEPVWAKNGRELYYLARDKIMSVAVSMAGSEFSFKPAVELFTAPTVFGTTQPPTYDVTADGRFVMIQWAETQPMTMRVVVNAGRAAGAAAAR